MSGQRAAVVIHPEPPNVPPAAVYAVRAAEQTRQAIALARARRQAAARARLREYGPPLDRDGVAKAAWSALADEGSWGPEWSGSPTDRALMAMRTAAPEADEVLGEVALRAAIAARLQDAPCAWCLVPEVAKVTGLPEPKLDSAYRRLLGTPCGGCLGRMRDQVLAEVLAGAPGGRRPPVRPAAPRTAPAAVTASATGPAPTGVLWLAGEAPPPAALRAAALGPSKAVRRAIPGYGAKIAREQRSVALHARGRQP